jgi:hypothetical protein
VRAFRESWACRMKEKIKNCIVCKLRSWINQFLLELEAFASREALCCLCSVKIQTRPFHELSVYATEIEKFRTDDRIWQLKVIVGLAT